MLLQLKKLQNKLQFPNMRIQTRLLAAGLILGIIAAANPISVSFHTTQIADYYSKKTMYWDLLYKIQQLNKTLAKSEAYLEPLNRDDVHALDTIVAEIYADDNSNEHLHSLYAQWRKRAFDSPTQERRNLVLEIQNLSKTLESTIRSQDEDSKRQLSTYIRNVKRFSIYGGSAFFIGFLLFVLSLWFTLTADFGILTEAMRQFKEHNLDHRIHIAGKTETAQLGRDFNEMADAIKKQNEKLKELNRLKTDFVSTVSHELRTPLTAIKGSIGLILGGVSGPVSPDLDQMLKITQKNTDRLIRLINDVLDIAKIEADEIKLRFDKYSLADVINRTIQGMDGYARSHEVNLIYNRQELSPLVVMDRDRIEQVMTNLLSNAIKFTPAGGVITVSYEWTGDRVAVHVEDTGKGIPDEFMSRMFERFQQAEGSSNKVEEGTGLGLAIVKGLVQEHGGQILVKSKVGVGSHFTFTIPWNGTEFAEVKKSKAA